jgi:hypothetical protein
LLAAIGGHPRIDHGEIGELAEVPNIGPGHVALDGEGEAVAAGDVASGAGVDADIAREAQEALDAGQRSQGRGALR